MPTGWRTRFRFGVMMTAALLLIVPYRIRISIGAIAPVGPRIIRRWYRRWGGGILTSGRIRLQLREQEALDPKQPVVFVANHQVAIDIPILMRAVPISFGFMAKSSVRRIPILGHMAASTGAVFIDRTSPRQALSDLKRAAERVRNGHSVLFFVEGTRSYAPVLADFRPGAFRLAVEAQVPLVPIALCNSYRLADERVFASQPGALDVVVGAPIPTAGRTRRDIPALINTVRRVLTAELAEEFERWSARPGVPSADP
ncbi:MAG: lysophospholipid acyltransferase family protein [Bacteroidota bacterium]